MFELISDETGAEKVRAEFPVLQDALDAMRALELPRGATAWVWDADRETVIDSRDSREE